jgi:hypothetical protein
VFFVHLRNQQSISLLIATLATTLGTDLSSFTSRTYTPHYFMSSGTLAWNYLLEIWIFRVLFYLLWFGSCGRLIIILSFIKMLLFHLLHYMPLYSLWFSTGQEQPLLLSRFRQSYNFYILGYWLGGQCW